MNKISDLLDRHINMYLGDANEDISLKDIVLLTINMMVVMENSKSQLRGVEKHELLVGRLKKALKARSENFPSIIEFLIPLFVEINANEFKLNKRKLFKCLCG